VSDDDPDDVEQPERISQPRMSGLMVAPSLAATLVRDEVAVPPAIMATRDAVIVGLAAVLAVAATGVAEVLVRAIALITNLAYYGRFDFHTTSPAGNQLGTVALLVPVVGGLVVGLMARYGSRAIRGHGIPEAMEQILTNESRIPLRITFLKPLSSAVAIGTGGPFGAEGPIIATGGALGSAIGQFIHTTASERKTLLAAGASAGMTAIFGTPIAGVLLAIELLLFEYRPRSVVPVAIACAIAMSLRMLLHGSDACFAMPELAMANGPTVAVAAFAGLLVGVISTYVTRAVYWVEDLFEHRVKLHWMWWPALGAVAVGLIGLVAPHTLGVGYDNIEMALSGKLTAAALAVLIGAKFVSWVIALGSGTSGGTLAPLLTLGSGLGWLFVAGLAAVAPSLDLDPRVGALVGMAAMFAGASRALLTSIIFAIEATHQINATAPIVAGVTLAYFMSCLMMKTTIMTEKLSRRGVHVPHELEAQRP
jgi:H+/Cl- antiporter ClcA